MSKPTKAVKEVKPAKAKGLARKRARAKIGWGMMQGIGILLWGLGFGVFECSAAIGLPPPQPASQAETDAGLLTRKFVSPATLAGYSLQQSTGSISAATATNIVVGKFAEVSPVTNQETRFITFSNSVYAPTNLAETVKATSVLAKTNFLSLAADANDAYINLIGAGSGLEYHGASQVYFLGEMFGGGGGLTNLHGTNLQALTVSNGVIADATINSNKLDAATLALFGTGSGTQTNISAAAVTNAGTAIWSNAAAFTLAPTNSGSSGQILSLTGDKTKWVADATGVGGTYTNWEAGVNANEYELYNIANLTGRASGGTTIQAYEGASRIQLYEGDALGIDYVVTDSGGANHTFIGPVVMTNLTTATAALGDNDTTVASTAFVQSAITNHSAINVKDYGATGDGSTDDTAAIQAALDAVPARGGFVFVPYSATGYRVDGTLYPKYGTTFMGEGNKIANAAQLNHSTGATPLISITNLGVWVKNMKLLGSGPTAGSVGIVVTNEIGSWGMEDVQIELFDSGINLGNCWIGDIVRARIRACVAGISFSNTVNNVTVSGGSILLCSNAIAGSFTASSANKFINGLNIERSRFGGINLSNSAGNLEISGCYFEWNTNYGVRLSGVQSAYSRPLVTKNFFTDSSTTQTNIYLLNAVGAVVSENSSTASAASTFLATDASSTNLIVAYNSHTGTNVIADMGVPQTLFIGNSQYRAGIGYTNAGFVGNFMGLIRSGDATNAAGSRVAYLSDTSASAQTNVTDTAAYSSQVNSNLTVKGNLTVNGTQNLATLNVTNFTVTTNWNGALVTNIPIAAIVAPAAILTNGMSVAASFSNSLRLSALSYLYLTNVTAGKVLTATTAGGVTNSGLGAVPINGDATATTFAQVQALAPSVIQTNGSSTSYSNNASITSPAYFSTTNSINTGAYVAGSSYFTNLTGNITLSPFTSIPATSWAITIAAKADGTARSVTFPNGVMDNSKTNTAAVAWVGANSTLVMQVVGFGSSFTNVLTPH